MRRALPATVAALAVFAVLTGGGAQAAASVATPDGVDQGGAARPASAFLDSVGVNTHFAYGDTPYSEGNQVQAAIADLGIRHIRDSLPRRPSLTYLRRIASLADAGIRTQLTVGSAGVPKGQPLIPLVEVTNGLSTLPSFAAALEAVEGPNEWDVRGGETWATQVRDYQCALAAALRSGPAKLDVMVVAPSLSRRANRPELGDLSGCVDVGNNHLYPRGGPTVEEFSTERSAASSRVAGGKPVIITETGYTNALRETNAKLPVNDAVAATYIPRLFATAFEAGNSRTFLYEFLDEKINTSLDDEEAHFGLLYHDLAPKPAYTALQRLLGLVTDTPGAAAATPGTLDYSISGGPEDLHDLLVSRTDGTMLLMLWRDVDVTPAGPGDDAEKAPVEIRFGEQVSQVDVHRPTVSGAPVTSTFDTTRVRGMLGADLVVLRIDPAAGPMKPVAHADGAAPAVLDASDTAADAFATSVRPDLGRTPASGASLGVTTILGVAGVAGAGLVAGGFVLWRRRSRSPS